MGQLAPLPMNVPAAVGIGTALDVSAYSEKWVQFTGTFVATLQLEGTIDGTNWAPLVATTIPGLFGVEPALAKLRVNVTVYVSGAPAAEFGGFEARSI